MTDKLCILQMADAGPAESTELMLRSVGYRVYLPDQRLRALLREIGCDTVLSPRDLTRGMGYDPVSIPEIGVEAVEDCDLFCDIKAQKNHDILVKKWPNLAGKILWTRINGARPEHVINERGDHGDEANPPCPVLTPNMWYQRHTDPDTGHVVSFGGVLEDGTHRAYACWPPFVRSHEYGPRIRPVGGWDKPVCFVHNLQGWGYGAVMGEFKRLFGLRRFGAGSPDGLVHHSAVPMLLRNASCMIHLKSSDAPGYALYEALASGCPVVCTKRLIWRCRMQDLLIPGETCLVFDRETDEGLTDEDVLNCVAEVKGHVEALQDPSFNRKIGDAGRERLKRVMWSEEKPEDVESLRQFMSRHFGG